MPTLKNANPILASFHAARNRIAKDADTPVCVIVKMSRL